MGWAAKFASLSLTAMLVYAAAIFWTIGYDTIYALQDLEDDAVVGIGSTARAYGPNAPRFIGACYAACLACLAIALALIGADLLAILAVVAFGLHLAWQVFSVKVDNPTRALHLFRANRDAGLVLFAGLTLDSLARWMSAG